MILACDITPGVRPVGRDRWMCIGRQLGHLMVSLFPEVTV